MQTMRDILLAKNIPVKPAPKLHREEEFMVINESLAKSDKATLTLRELMDKNFPESQWVAERLIPEGLTVLSAQPASFKTWLILDLAISVASGNTLFETFETKQSGVLMIDEENSPRLLQQRLNLLGRDVELPIHFMIEQSFKLEDGQIGRIIKYCRKHEIRLITFDSLVRIHTSNENDAVQMSEVFAKIRKFTKAGISVLVTHHNRKSNGENPGQDMRGSSDILASVDCHISLKRDRESRRLTIIQTKVRFSEELPPIELEVTTENESVGFQYIGTAQIETKRMKTKRAVGLLLTELGSLNQQDLLAALEDHGNKVNAKTLRLILKNMEQDKELVTRTGKGSEIIYSMAN